MTQSTRTRLTELLDAQQANREAYSRATREGDAAGMRALRIESMELDVQIRAAYEAFNVEAEVARDLEQQRQPLEQARRREKSLEAGRMTLDRRNVAFKRLIDLEIERRGVMRQLLEDDKTAKSLFASTVSGPIKECFEGRWDNTYHQFIPRLVSEAA
jgi:hypothetical protein